MSYIEGIKLRKRYVEREISVLSNEVSKMPEGTLSCYKNGKYDKWFCRMPNSTDRTFIRKKDFAFAEELARKGYFLRAIKDLQKELKNINSYLKGEAELSHPPGSSYYAINESHRKLLKSTIEPSNPAVDKFLSEQYVGAGHSEGLIYECKNGLYVRSKSENEIVDHLYSYGIPFQYEYPFEIYNYGHRSTIYPDFRLFDYYANKIILWEHFGLMDDPQYARNAGLKIGHLSQIGFYPDDNLILTFESKNHKLSSAEIVEKINKFFPWADIARFQ